MPEHLRERLQARDVAVVVGAEHVDEPVVPPRELAANVGRVLGEVGRRPVGADEDAVLVVAVAGRPRPDRAVLLVRVEQRDRLGDLGLDLGLPRPRVEVDAEALERRLHLREHRRHRVARQRGELLHVRAAIAVLRRLFATPQRLDRLVEALHLRAGVVVVVLALDVVARELEEPGDGVAVRGVTPVSDRDRPGRVRRDHLHLDALAARRPSPRRTPHPPPRSRGHRRRATRPRARG